ncbi:MAG: hypothetical protein ACOWYE_03610 [Desulfatiglandales bacterium]
MREAPTREALTVNGGLCPEVKVGDRFSELLIHPEGDMSPAERDVKAFCNGLVRLLSGRQVRIPNKDRKHCPELLLPAFHP